ncbi:hypothetical protein H0H93_013847 [Arthromyces matolae]|nr:hypothetical protein H0H93_013847 [Arthromyces matolae]
MDNDSTFIAPEGVYTVTDEHKPLSLISSFGGPVVYPTKITSVVVTYPPHKQPGTPAFVQLLGGSKDTKKDKYPVIVTKERDDGNSLSSSDTPDEGDIPPSSQEHTSNSQSEPHTLFSPNPTTPGKKKQSGRPKHNIRTTSSSFITRTQTAEVSHADGSIVVYDKERDDGVFTPQDPIARSHDHSGATVSDDGSLQKEWDPTESIFVTMPPWHPVTSGTGIASNGKSDKDKVAKNPEIVAKRLATDFVFSPDVKYVSAISEDGCLRVIDALAEQLVDCYASYFGSLTCVAWSHDGRFILTGGQDDLVTIFSPWEQRVVARCQGHSSFVSALAFDDLRCDGRTYRFGSVGEDNKFILWDFSSGALHRPKLQVERFFANVLFSISMSFQGHTSTTDVNFFHHLLGTTTGSTQSSYTHVTFAFPGWKVF